MPQAALHHPPGTGSTPRRTHRVLWLNVPVSLVSIFPLLLLGPTPPPHPTHAQVGGRASPTQAATMRTEGGGRKSFNAATTATTDKRRRSHTGPTTVAVAVQPRKVIKRRLSATAQKAPPPRARHLRGSGTVSDTVTITTTKAASSKGKRTGRSSSGASSSTGGQRLGSRFPTPGTTFSTSEPATFNVLPGDVQARVLFSGYFDTLFVLNRLSLVSKRMYDLASSCYQEMDLSRLPNLGPEELAHLVSRFKGLRKLDMSFCDAIDDEMVIALTPLEGTLTSLILRGCNVSDMGLIALGGFTRLECLDVSKRYAEQTLIVTDYGLIALKRLRRLREVSLAWNKCVTDEGIASLVAAAQGVKQLRVLDVSCCVGLTDAVCESLVGQPLEYLSFLGCPMITDKSLGMLFARESFSAPHSYYPNNYPHTSPPSSPPALPASPATPTAAGTATFAVTPRAGALSRSSSSSSLPSTSAASSFPTSSITFLSLAHCEALTDVGVEILMTLPKLVELDMRDCRRVTKEGRSKLQKWLPVASVDLS